MIVQVVRLQQSSALVLLANGSRSNARYEMMAVGGSVGGYHGL